MIPKDFVESNLKLAKGSTFLGVYLEDMTKDELMAICYYSNESSRQRELQHSEEISFFGRL